MSNATRQVKRAAARKAERTKAPAKTIPLRNLLQKMADQINTNTRMIAELEKVVEVHDKRLRVPEVEAAPTEEVAP